MGFESFMQKPKSYLKTHNVFIGNSYLGGNSVAAGAPAANGAGGNSIRFTLTGTDITMKDQQNRSSSNLGMLARSLKIAPNIRRDFIVTNSPNDVGLRFLPYRDGAVTYMSLDHAARFFITGPLSGCSIGAGRVNGEIWTFHAYATAGNHGNAARTQQRDMINNVRMTIGVGAVHICQYQREYTGQGFVFGLLRNGGIWKFYAYGSGSGLTKICEI